MAKITGVNRNTVVLDPCCGSGAFLVRAMTLALDDCANGEEQEKVKKKHIHGIEYDENVFGLATTNMLIHSDGNSNILNGSCFDYEEEIKEASPNVILLNPPYNSQKRHMSKEITQSWSKRQKEDPTKGLAFVKYIADILNDINKQAKIAVLLPIACAIGSSKTLKNIRKQILQENTLDAVFTMPNEVFYPGASASVCCMVFNTGVRHDSSSNPDTFFGYYKDDGFKKKKNLGRVEQINPETGNSRWVEIEKKWIDLYINRTEEDGLSAIQKVSYDDEWLCEAYMKTDYSTLTDEDFQQTRNNYLAYYVKEGNFNNLFKFMENYIKSLNYKPLTTSVKTKDKKLELNVDEWKEFKLGKLFKQQRGKEKAPNQNEAGEIPIVNETSYNNGIVRFVEPTKIFKGNAITISINVAENVFYQQDDFCASVNIAILKNSWLTKNIGIFIVSLLKHNNKRYSYGYKTNKAKINTTVISLPIIHKTDKNGNKTPKIDLEKKYSKEGYIPDFEFMEEYMKQLPYGDRL
jgi:hypothetical protein